MPSRQDHRHVSALLSNIDWSFDTPLYSRARSPFLFDCRKYHWYPATFVPELPYSLIEILSAPGQTVLDPFAGIGTTVVQALLLGRRPYGIEKCRVAVEYVRGLWELLDPRTNVPDVSRSLVQIHRQYDRKRRYDMELLELDEEYGGLLQQWFNEQTFNEIAFLVLTQRRQQLAPVRSALTIALSATLKATTAQDKGWGCIADNVLPNTGQRDTFRPALLRCSRNWTQLLRGIAEARSRMTEDARLLIPMAGATDHVRYGDARFDTAVTEPSIDLVITSPPYPNMTDYATSQRLSYYFLQSRPDDDFRSEIGARRRRKRKDALGLYRRDLAKALDLIVEQMRPGAYACFVMPTFSVHGANNRDRRRAVDECMATLIDAGLTQVCQFERALPVRRRQHNRHWATLQHETIHVYRRI